MQIEFVVEPGQVAAGERLDPLDATGVRFIEVPLLRNTVWRAVEEHRAAGAEPGRPAGRQPSREGSV
nr:hypothetical protein [Streptomyces lydicus]